MDWISAQYNFGMRIKGVAIPGRLMRTWDFKYCDLFKDPESEKIEAKLKKLPIWEYLPSDAFPVRICLSVNQDALVLYLVSSQFPPAEKEYGIIDVIAVEDLIAANR